MWGILFFLVLDEGIGALTLLLPVALVGGCVFCSATVLGCRLVVEQTSSRPEEPFNLNSQNTEFFDPLFKD